MDSEENQRMQERLQRRREREQQARARETAEEREVRLQGGASESAKQELKREK